MFADSSRSKTMSPRNFLKFSTCLVCLLACLSIAMVSVVAQTESIAELKERADQLLKQVKYVEAVPLLEKIVEAEPKNAEMHYSLASALLGQAANASDGPTRKALRIRARNEFIRAKELGNNAPNIDAMIQGLPADGSESAFSANEQAHAVMVKAEAYFAQGKMDEALKEYQKALALDPKLYDAALFSGDVYMEKEDFDQAEVWYQKAIAINPNRETAYRYSATPLMKQGKTDVARGRYIEAFITEPYNKFAVSGLVSWGRTTGTNLAHPKIDIPTEVTFDEKGDAKINLNASALLGKDDGGFAWIIYGTTRSTWHKEKFAKTFPGERTYRHSLPEEAEALRAVIALATSDKKVKTLNSSIAMLKKIDDAGLLEAYILMAIPDQGIARDHPAYLKDNRDKLRRYVVEVVVNSGGN
jgi:tetratricopeptide (TPR) repeat protein